MRDLKIKKERGSVFDLFTYSAYAIAIVIVIIALMKMGDSFTDAFKVFHDKPQYFSNNVSQTNTTQIYDNTIGKIPSALTALNWLGIGMLIAMVIAIFISALFVRSHPIFAVVYFFFWMLAIIVSIPVSNTFETLANDANFASYINDMSGISHVINNLPIWILVVGGIGAILMFGIIIRTEDFGSGEI